MAIAAPKKPRYALAGNKHIAAALNDLFKFRSATLAEAKLTDIKRQFTITRQQDESITAPHVILWIRDYEVSTEEEAAGYLGNYACIRVHELPYDDIWTLKVSKVARELKHHPLRKRPAARCPNWGHPVLRRVEKGHHYATLAEATEALETLHLEYPETTIPGENKLYLMIFSRRDPSQNPIQKYVFEIDSVHGGGFIITSQLNTYTPKSVVPESAEQAEKAGHFASMVALRKRRKKPV
jgi:hypothetical protein